MKVQYWRIYSYIYIISQALEHSTKSRKFFRIDSDQFLILYTVDMSVGETLLPFNDLVDRSGHLTRVSLNGHKKIKWWCNTNIFKRANSRKPYHYVMTNHRVSRLFGLMLRNCKEGLSVLAFKLIGCAWTSSH